ncbi:hypothetical protein B0H10DRAFT_1225712 [Mycena sp. CBHHK59/15]|nr:hypothetical protein B0H10DRAFT_1225712 [Mycena sp. CBHHK59/15]
MNIGAHSRHAFIPSNTVRYIALGFAVIYFGGCVVHPGLPSVKMKQLEEYIEETSKIYAKAIPELERNPLFTAQAGLELAQVKFSESVLRSKTLGAKDVAWRDYFEHLRCLSFYIDECQRQAREVRTSVLLALEADRQKRYMEDIAQRRTTPDTTAFPRSSAYSISFQLSWLAQMLTVA